MRTSKSRGWMVCADGWRGLAGGLLLLAGLVGAQAAARESHWLAEVTHVSDGDTVWVQPARGGSVRKVRIDGIDAPEICQLHGVQAREVLADRVQGRTVLVSARRKDDYGRLLARLTLQEHDVGHWMVAQGHAWSYRYRRSDGPYAVEEAQARAGGLGLWRQARPMPPRTFRQRYGSCH